MADDPLIPLSTARAQNRAIFARTIAILSVVGMIALGWFGYRAYQDLHSKQSPCATDLNSPECIARFCTSVNSAGYPLSQTCKHLLARVNEGNLNPGPGAEKSFPHLKDTPTLNSDGRVPQGGGGGSGGSGRPPGSSPGGGGGGSPQPLTPAPSPAPPAAPVPAKPPLNVQVPLPTPTVCTPVLGVNC